MTNKDFFVEKNDDDDDDKSEINWDAYRGLNELKLIYKKDHIKLDCNFLKLHDKCAITLETFNHNPYSINIINDEYVDRNG
ncbi:unnamed protein product, partial [Rotaria sp. Silwood1]